MENELKLFIPIMKVDEEKRLVYGKVTEEAVDSAGEIFDYATSKPYFKEWTEYFSKATDGKSYGNLRAMHDAKKAIGSLPEVSLNDREKSVEVVAKVVDDQEWSKVLEGVYTGFSQGGAYVKRWPDTNGAYRYTAKPTEISLVDYPCLKTATFQVVKADGIVEDRAFRKTENKTSSVDLKKWAGEEISDARTALTALEEISYLYSKETTEGDAGQAADLKAVIDKLKNFIASEIKEDTTEGITMEMAERIAELKKAMEGLTDELVKAHSKETMGKIQGIHDHSMALGAKCNTGKVDDVGDLTKVQGDLAKATEGLAKITGERDEALKKITALEGERDLLKAKVAELEKKPDDPKAVKTVTKSGDNQADGSGDPPKLEKTGDPVKDEASALELVKRAQQAPKSITAPFNR